MLSVLDILMFSIGSIFLNLWCPPPAELQVESQVN